MTDNAQEQLMTEALAGGWPPLEYVKSPRRPKGYWIARLDVTDAEAYKTYVEANAVAFAKYGATFLTRGGPYWTLEGNSRSRNVILEFESVSQAMRCYWSPEYQVALNIRRGKAEADIIIMEGYNGPQPPEQPGDKANVRAAQ